MESHVLFSAFIFLAAACIVVPLASRFKLGAVLGYIIAGVVIGPYVFGFINNPEEILHFAEFGVVMMLFLIGLELEPPMLWRMRHMILGLGGAQVLMTTGAFTMIGLLLGYSATLSLAVSMALALSSTALVVQMLQEKELMHTSMGEHSFAVLLFQDIAVIGILVLMPLLAVSGSAPDTGHETILSHLPVYAQTLAVAAVIAGIVVGGRYLSYYMFYFIARTNVREVFTAISLALVIGITLVMQSIGISPALGAFIAGVMLANSEYKHSLEADIFPFKGLLLGLFFISVGMGMDFSLFADKPLELTVSIVGLMFVKFLILLALGRFFKLPPLQNAGFAMAMCQGSEFAFVLLQYAGVLNIISTEHAAFVTLMVACSMALSPLVLMFYTQRVVPRFMSLLPHAQFDVIEEKHPIIIAGYGRFGQIIGRFMRAQGIKITILEKDPGQIALLRKFGFKGYFGDASRLDLLRSAGAERASILIITIANVDVCSDIAQKAKEHFPNLKVFVRARDRRHAYELDKIGVHYFRRDTFDSALTMAQQVMVQLGHKESDMQFRALQFMRHDEATLRKSFAFFEKENELISFSRDALDELEQLLQSDIDTPIDPAGK